VAWILKYLNQSSFAMNKFFFIILTALTVTSFRLSSNPESADINRRNDKKLTQQEEIKEAIESRRFAVKLDRLYMFRYGYIDLLPDRNYIIINGNKAAINAAYIGRQRGFFPIAGIRFIGESSVYKLHKNNSKGNYRIVMEVTGENDIYHILLNISENGKCSTTITGNWIDNVKYSGEFVLIEIEKTVPEPDAIKI
jgi:hypothetical protein